MARPRTEDGLEKITINIVQGDRERLQRLHPNLNYSVVIRTLIRAHIARVEAALPTPEIEIDLEEINDDSPAS